MVIVGHMAYGKLQVTEYLFPDIGAESCGLNKTAWELVAVD